MLAASVIRAMMIPEDSHLHTHRREKLKSHQTLNLFSAA
jgi:hypothetical protein